jgi:pyruvate,water dikinase
MAPVTSIRWFRDIRLDDVALVGGKNASLGELYSVLSEQGLVPNGFALTADAYRNALTEAGAWERLHPLLDSIDKTQIDVLARCAAEARAIVFDATGTDRLRQEIADSYRQLENDYGANVAVAVRSSATAEDLPTASFAGQHESFLNVRGATDLFEACRYCFASIFTDRAISYRIEADARELGAFQPGEVLVAESTSPDWGAGHEGRCRDRDRARRTAAGRWCGRG